MMVFDANWIETRAADLFQQLNLQRAKLKSRDQALSFALVKSPGMSREIVEKIADRIWQHAEFARGECDPPSKMHWCPNPDIIAAIAREVLSGALTCQCGRLNPENCLEDPCRAPRFASKKKIPRPKPGEVSGRNT